MARQFYDRFAVEACYTNLPELIRGSSPDVVHITTPPESHYQLARICLEMGSHVYVEKPFTLYEYEAQELISLANQRGLKVTVGHDDQFSHVARRMRALVHDGFLGESLVHMESHYCYELGDSPYVRALLGDNDHWVRRLPGKLLHNIISHGIARMVEFLSDDSPEVEARGYIRPFLKGRGESEIFDELRVMISQVDGATAHFVFSSQMRPSMHTFRLYGNENGLILDQDHETLIKMHGARYTSYADKFIPPIIFAKQHLNNVATNLGFFVSRDFHMKAGMKYLIESFYQSIEGQTPAPIPYREILLTARIMDAIFAQLYPGKVSPQARLSLQLMSKG